MNGFELGSHSFVSNIQFSIISVILKYEMVLDINKLNIIEVAVPKMILVLGVPGQGYNV